MSKFVWIDSLRSNDIASGAQSVWTLMTGPAAVQTRFDNMTLMRTIIRLDVAAVVHDQGEGSNIHQIGIAIASQEAFAAQTLPDPNIATDYPTAGWIYRSSGRVFGFQAGVADVQVLKHDADIRSRRKLSNGEMYVIQDNIALEGTGVAITTVGLIRCLWLVS